MNPEVGVNFSGGGFSRYFDQPDYQVNAISNYLGALGTKYSGMFKYGGSVVIPVETPTDRHVLSSRVWHTAQEVAPIRTYRPKGIGSKSSSEGVQCPLGALVPVPR